MVVVVEVGLGEETSVVGVWLTIRDCSYLKTQLSRHVATVVGSLTQVGAVGRVVQVGEILPVGHDVQC